MKHTLKAVVAGLLLAGSSAAFANNPPPTIKADAPNRYVVKKGDTLWDISGKYLNAPHRWREIWATNKQIKNPNLIYPNDVLILCLIRGQTLVGIDTGEGCAGVEKQMQEAQPTALPTPDAAPPQAVAITSYEQSIPAIPLSSIRAWLARAVVVDPRDYDNTPYVLASKDGNLITSVGNKVYARGTPLIVGQRYGIYRKGEPYVDTTNKQLLGLEATQVAAAVVTDTRGDVSSLQILESYGYEVREGDRVFVEADAVVPPIFYPAPAEVTRGGQIARVMSGIGSAAKHSVVAINLGAAHGAKPGHILDVYKKGALVRDVYDNDTPVRLPSELVGQLMVFKTFNYVSYAYVLSADGPINVGDRLLSPEQ